jgi:peptidoglycan/LPS O-acetylase OafA/YrhL
MTFGAAGFGSISQTPQPFRHASPSFGSIAMISDTSRRPDLDGLRAIAVLSVIFAHAGFSGLSGGWVGVDVFFVLSGYLITGILLRSFRDQTFSWRGFFARRLRRLAPAFLGVGVISIAVFSFLMPPRLFMPAMETLAWSAVGVGNFEMARQIDYFADDDSLNPFTHLWSLGIEEQFYLVFPALLLLAWKRRHAQALVLFLLALSLYALWISRDLPASYFLPWTRAWGLLMGAALAIHAQPGGRPFPAWTGWIGGGSPRCVNPDGEWGWHTLASLRSIGCRGLPLDHRRA